MRFTRFVALSLGLALAGPVACTMPGPTGASPAKTARRTPVVFVHGYLLGPSQWTTAINRFKAKGYTDADLMAIKYDYNVSVVDSARTLAQAVDTLRARTGAPKVDIVSHSMGSLVTKQCIIAGGCATKVAHWMSISGVDNGTALELSPGLPSNEDVQGHTPVRQYLQDHWGDLVAQGVKVEVQWAPLDLIVWPSTLSKEPPPAVNKQVSVILNHLTIYLAPGVIDESIRFLGT
jgi:triacylglycerol lipase